ncbi:class I SAM-dependent methyltransferase [Methylobacillus arboreus]|uniref:class I SAM-dependent methyltransferase n=1 Tax=Methylobacillus arboreus TaxID=755170 RepID=UPI001E63C444|nr:class I SAM-dependent methyltransferase [Methylobacillus arboreus]MCB5189299.1 class I SAM-dependent methyltransferase [Methylobacillus arboreus]
MQFKQGPTPELSGARRRFPPAILAFFIQVAALVLLWCMGQVVSWLEWGSLPGWALFLAQGAFASLLSMLLGMAVWWRLIHLLFPLAILFMLQWQVPAWAYLLAFCFTLALFWSTYRTQVPFYPSLPATWRQVKDLIPVDKPVSVLDIGSGLGGLVMYLARERPNATCAGIELAPLPWLLSVLLAVLKKSPAIFKYGDYQAVNLSRYDVVFAYLSPAAMPDLWRKAEKEMQAGSLLISYEFEIPGVAPKLQIQERPDAPSIFVWEF